MLGAGRRVSRRPARELMNAAAIPTSSHANRSAPASDEEQGGANIGSEQRHWASGGGGTAAAHHPLSPPPGLVPDLGPSPAPAPAPEAPGAALLGEERGVGGWGEEEGGWDALPPANLDAFFTRLYQ